MSPLDDRNFTLLVKIRQPVPCVVNHKSEHSQALRHTELVRVCAPFSLQHHAVVRLEHDELQLHVIRDIWCPNPLGFLLQIKVELHMVFELVVLGVSGAETSVFLVATFSELAVTQVARTNHA